jgi:hypothetical protein
MMPAYTPSLDIRSLYDAFDTPVTEFDCGEKCRSFNPSGKPFCCDICHAVPVGYKEEWDFVKTRTDLWHLWRGDECPSDPTDPADLAEQTPEHLLLLACKGPANCQRQYRSTSCRQFPFFPYVTEDFRFIGLAYEWEFEKVCWVISHLETVSETYRKEFIKFYDDIFCIWPDEFESYAALSEDMRTAFSKLHRRIPILHRNGDLYLVSPGSERLTCTDFTHLKKFGFYK